MFTACVQHCRYLSLSPNDYQTDKCAANSLNCHKYRLRYPADSNRERLEQTLNQLFKPEELGGNADIVELTGAIHARDRETLDKLLKNMAPTVDWIQPAYAGIGNDWGGTKISVVYKIDHPHLQATLGLVLGIARAKLTLGRIDYASAEVFCRAAAGMSRRRYPKTVHTAGHAQTRTELQLI
jgi:hypothetical protein